MWWGEAGAFATTGIKPLARVTLYLADKTTFGECFGAL